MFGLPDHHMLSQVVHELTRTHVRTVGQHTGQEPALLALLEVAIKSDTSGAYGGGATRTGAPVDTAALQLWQEITACVGEHWPGRGDLAQAKVRLIPRLERWTEYLAGDAAYELHLLEMVMQWRSQIRNLLEPPARVPIRGGTCPRCGFSQAWQRNQDAELVLVPCLLAHLSEEPIRAECLACGEQYVGGQLADLGAVAEFTGT